MQIAMHQLKAGLSKYVAQAQAGEVIAITSHDTPVAMLIGIPATSNAGLARLLASGAVQWAGGKPRLDRAVTLTSGGKTVSEMVLEDRG